MTDKSVEQMARDTLNALIAGEYIKHFVVKSTAEGPKIDKELLRNLELQLREYHSIDLEEKKAGYTAGLKGLGNSN